MYFPSLSRSVQKYGTRILDKCPEDNPARGYNFHTPFEGEDLICEGNFELGIPSMTVFLIITVIPNIIPCLSLRDLQSSLVWISTWSLALITYISNLKKK